MVTGCFDDLDFENDWGYCSCDPVGSQYYCEWVAKCAVTGNPYCDGMRPRPDLDQCRGGLELPSAATFAGFGGDPGSITVQLQGEGDPLTIMGQTTCLDDNYYYDDYGWCECDYDGYTGITTCHFMSDNCGGPNPYC